MTNLLKAKIDKAEPNIPKIDTNKKLLIALISFLMISMKSVLRRYTPEMGPIVKKEIVAICKIFKSLKYSLIIFVLRP